MEYPPLSQVCRCEHVSVAGFELGFTGGFTGGASAESSSSVAEVAPSALAVDAGGACDCEASDCEASAPDPAQLEEEQCAGRTWCGQPASESTIRVVTYNILDNGLASGLGLEPVPGVALDATSASSSVGCELQTTSYDCLYFCIV